MPVNITMRFARLPHGLVYYYQHWIPQDPRALVVYVHGFGDHIGRACGLVGRLVELDCACALFDQRGHGRSEGRRGHIDRFMDWVDDLASFIHFSRGEVAPEVPVFIVATSLGALIGINYLLTHAAPIAGMVTLGAAISPTVSVPEWKKRIGQRLARLMPLFSIDNGVLIEELTRDETEMNALMNDELFHRRVTLWAGQEILANVALTQNMACRIHVPMLMLAGGDDRVCDPAASVSFAKALSSTERYYQLYSGMYHDLLHDTGKEQVMDDVAGWILEMARRAAPANKQFALNRREPIWENVSHPLQQS
ncbi:MAG: lysophospholipase [bacterium]